MKLFLFKESKNDLDIEIVEQFYVRDVNDCHESCILNSNCDAYSYNKLNKTCNIKKANGANLINCSTDYICYQINEGLKS